MELTLYSANWCPDCRVAKRFLDKHNIAYREVNIEKTPGAADELIQNVGKRAVPQFVIDGQWVQPYRPGEGFLYHEMAEILGNKYPPAEPEVLRLLAPQRGLIATGQSQKQDLVSYRPARVFVIGVKRTPGFVELLLPPRQSRGISLRISVPP